MATLILARHGETDWNLYRRVQGHSDTPLNDTGRDQARALAQRLGGAGIDAVYSSDLVRAHETARIVADSLGLDVTAIADLRERHFGSWEGLTADEVLERYPHAAHGPWGDGETRDEMTERVTGALRRIAGSHPDGVVLVVTHGGPLRAALLECGIEDAGPLENCCTATIAVNGHAMRAG